MSPLPRMIALATLCSLAACKAAPAEERRGCIPTRADALGPFYVADTLVVDDHPAASDAYADYDDDAIDLRGTLISDGKAGYGVKTLLPGVYIPRPRHFRYRITAADRAAPLEAGAGGLHFAALDIFLTVRE